MKRPPKGLALKMRIFGDLFGGYGRAVLLEASSLQRSHFEVRACAGAVEALRGPGRWQ